MIIVLIIGCLLYYKLKLKLQNKEEKEQELNQFQNRIKSTNNLNDINDAEPVIKQDTIDTEIKYKTEINNNENNGEQELSNNTDSTSISHESLYESNESLYDNIYDDS